MSTSENRVTFADDDRGAVMVMGIFMCSCLVAGMWYLAGLGDAILYHERMQEAADAVAFSDAALHARAMNLLVLINLIMSIILAIRVALRVGKLACTIAAAVFAALSFVQPEFAALAGPCAAAASTLDTVDNSVKPVIEAALKGLMAAQDGIVQATPVAMHVGALAIGAEYSPVVKDLTNVAAYRPMDGARGVTSLPVTRGDPAKLCKESVTSMDAVFEWVADKATKGLLTPAVAALGAFMEAIVGASPDYFCDLTAGSTQTDDPKQVDDNAMKECKDPSNVLAGLQQNFFGNPPSGGSEKRWEDACAACHVTCEGFDPILKLPDGTPAPLEKSKQTGQCTASTDPNVSQAVLDADRLQRDQDVRSMRTFQKSGSGLAGCFVWARDDIKTRKSENDQQEQKEAQQVGKPGDNGTSQGQQSGGDNIAPLRVDRFQNNSQEGIFIGAVLGDETRLTKDSKMVRLGSFNSKRTPQDDTSSAKLPAWAQAELFFDCGGKWGDAACNGPEQGKDGEDAMWHFQWRPRLRRFNQQMDRHMQRLGDELPFQPPLKNPDTFADDLSSEAPASSGSGSTNAALRRELSNTIKANGIRDQGAH